MSLPIRETPQGDFVTVGTLIENTGTSAGHINKVSDSGEFTPTPQTSSSTLPSVNTNHYTTPK